MTENIKFFKALADPNRVRILKMLAGKTLCVCELQSVLGLAVSTVSNHLAVLKDAGLIKEEKEGKWINYSLNYNADDQRIPELIDSLDFWIKDDKQIKEDLKKIMKVDRYKICKS